MKEDRKIILNFKGGINEEEELKNNLKEFDEKFRIYKEKYFDLLIT
jgi:hypothetical protein